MKTYTNCWKPIHVVHIADNDSLGHTLCGLPTDEYRWEFGGEVEDSEDEAMFTCQRCGRALAKLERGRPPEESTNDR